MAKNSKAEILIGTDSAGRKLGLICAQKTVYGVFYSQYAGLKEVASLKARGMIDGIEEKKLVSAIRASKVRKTVSREEIYDKLCALDSAKALMDALLAQTRREESEEEGEIADWSALCEKYLNTEEVARSLINRRTIAINAESPMIIVGMDDDG